MRFSWKHLTIRSKIVILGVFLVSSLVLVIFLHFLPTVESSILDKKKEKIKEITEAASSVLKYFHEENIRGKMTLKEAQAQSIKIIKQMRYGPEGKDYLWINDYYPNMIMHPYVSKLDGTDISNYKDKKGKRLFSEMARVCKSDGEGYVDYMWQWKNEKRIVPKISFVKAFAPWQWIVGTGIYIEDVREEILSIKVTIAGISVGLYIVSIFLLIMFAKSITSPLSRVVELATEVSRGNLNAYLSQNQYVRCSEEKNCKDRDCPAYDSHDLACWRIPETHDENGNPIKDQSRKLEKCKKCKVYKKGIRNEIDQLIEAINNMIVSNSKILNNLKGVVISIDDSVIDLKKAIDEEATAMNQQMASIEQTTSTMEELNSISKEIENSSSLVVDSLSKNINISHDSKNDLNDLLEIINNINEKNEINTMDIRELSEKSKQINDVMSIIDGIASQTKLIAFNATIEAAGSGELGMRFTIVADEIRRLAGSVMEATDEIKNEIKEIQEVIARILTSSKGETAEIEKGVESSKKTGHAFEKVINMSEESFDSVEKINESISQQKSATEQVLFAVKDISDGSVIINDNIGNIVDHIDSFTELSEKLKELMSHFVFNDRFDNRG